MTAKQTIKYIITTVAILVATTHLVFPDIKIDMVIVALIAMATIPWLEPLFKSIGLPGGIQFEFQDLKKIEADAKKAGLITDDNNNNEAFLTSDNYSFVEIADKNKELALLTLRIEIEKTLRQIAASHKITTAHFSVAKIITTLEQHTILTKEETDVLNNMLPILNQAVHGSTYDERTANWVMENGPSIISNLEKKIKR